MVNGIHAILCRLTIYDIIIVIYAIPVTGRFSAIAAILSMVHCRRHYAIGNNISLAGHIGFTVITPPYAITISHAVIVTRSFV